MNSKLICQILKKKHADFTDSITEPEVRALVSKNSIITGGSIVSLLTNEPINDYDYYFTDKNTAIAVAQYYVAQFIKLHPERSVQPEVRVLEDRVTISVANVGLASEKGMCLDDLLPEEQEAILPEKGTANAADDGQKYRPVFLSANAITLSNKVQLVIRFYGDPNEIHRNYDYVHCCNYWLSSSGELVLHPGALESILTKNLYYQGSLYPICSLIRMRKFLKRGWHINAGQILKMCFQVSRLDLSNLDVLKEQLIGVDALYFHELIAYCRKEQGSNPNFTMDVPFIVAAIDKIFG